MRCPQSELTRIIMLAVALTTVAQSSVIRRSTIENPCITDPTSTVSDTYQSLDDQINSTIIAARTANETCETLKETLRRYLTETERSSIDARPMTIAGLTAAYTATNMNQANVFTRVLRHSVLNITLLYNMLERVILTGRLHSFDSTLRHLMSSMIKVRCRVTLTSEVRESTFTAQEMLNETEMALVDYDLYTNAEEAMEAAPLLQNATGLVHVVYSLAGYMQAYMGVLEEALQSMRR